MDYIVADPVELTQSMTEGGRCNQPAQVVSKFIEGRRK